MRDIIQKISLRELRILVFGLGAALCAATASGFVVPGVKAFHAARAEVRNLESATQDGDRLELELNEQYASIESLQRQLNGDMANLPVQQIEAYIIGRLQRVSWGNNVELISVEPATGERIQVFQELLFKVQLVGRYNDLYRWLLDTRADLGYVVIKEYALSRNSKDDNDPLLFADLSIASYRAVE